MAKKPAQQIDLFQEPPALAKLNTKVVSKVDDSPYIVYVDESGDHSLTSINGRYLVFVLAFCVFHKEYYSNKVVPSVEQLKFRNFGHDIVVLHESDIRKEIPPFNVFSKKTQKEYFFNELNEIILASKFILISSVIFKNCYLLE